MKYPVTNMKGTKMSEHQTFSQRWEEFRPSKALWFWSVAGAAVVTMIVGFTFGGWTTGGNAADMAERAARDARAELVATVCVQKFAAEADAAAKLAALKEASSWERNDFVEDGGWVLLTGMEEVVPGAADACVDHLIAMDSLPPREVQAEPATTDS
jgi:hypothetical protein